jgi:hypothetical protein
MKCLMRMFAKENKGVIFFETCLSFKQQKHTYIEAIPLPVNEYNDAPAYFRVCSSHKAPQLLTLYRKPSWRPKPSGRSTKS